MQDYFDSEFYDIVFNEYGVTDELDILSETVLEITTWCWVILVVGAIIMTLSTCNEMNSINMYTNQCENCDEID